MLWNVHFNEIKFSTLSLLSFECSISFFLLACLLFFFHDWTNSNCQEFSSSHLKFFTPWNFKGIVGKRDKTVWKKWPRKKEGFWLGSVCTLQKWPKFAVRRTSSLICSHMENVKYRHLLLYRPPSNFHVFEAQ